MAFHVQHQAATAGSVPRMPAGSGMMSPVRPPQRRKSSHGGSLPPQGCVVPGAQSVTRHGASIGAPAGSFVPLASYDGPSPVRHPSPSRSSKSALVVEPVAKSTLELITARPHYQAGSATSLPTAVSGSPLGQRTGSAHNLCGLAASPVSTVQHSASAVGCLGGRPSVPFDEAMTARTGIPPAIWAAARPAAPGSYQPPGRAIRQQSGGSIPTSSPGSSTNFREPLQNLKEGSWQKSENIKTRPSGVEILTAKDTSSKEEIAGSNCNDLLLEKMEMLQQKFDNFVGSKTQETGKENVEDEADMAKKFQQKCHEVDEVKAMYLKEVSVNEQKQRELEEIQRRFRYEPRRREGDDSFLEAAKRERAQELEDRCHELEMELSDKRAEVETLKNQHDRQMREASVQIEQLQRTLDARKSTASSQNENDLRAREVAVNALQKKLAEQQARIEQDERRLIKERQELQQQQHQRELHRLEQSTGDDAEPAAGKKKPDEVQGSALKKKVEDQKKQIHELECQIRREQKVAKHVTPGEHLKIVKACEEEYDLAYKNSCLVLKIQDLEADLRKRGA